MCIRDRYSNLSILSSLQLSELKIDKSIINDLYSNQNTRILVEHLIHICRQLGIDSVAEGVEEREQLQILEDIGCTYAQGLSLIHIYGIYDSTPRRRRQRRNVKKGKKDLTRGEAGVILTDINRGTGRVHRTSPFQASRGRCERGRV